MNEIKNKADELINAYLNLQIHGLSTIQATERAKQCALILCDEVMKVAPISNYSDVNHEEMTPEEIGLEFYTEFWQQVKSYIENNY